MKMDTNLQKAWDKLEVGLDDIMINLSRRMSFAQYIDLYTTVYNYCATPVCYQNSSDNLQAGANPIGEGLYLKLKDYLVEHLEKINKKAQGQEGYKLLEFLLENWDRYTTSTALISNIMQYINRHWVRRHIEEKNPTYDTYTLALVLWKEHLITGAQNLQNNVISAILDLVRQDRNGTQVNHRLIKKVLGIFVSMSVESVSVHKQYPEIYRELFEVSFLEQTNSYYTIVSNEYIEKHGVVPYMRMAKEIFDKEARRMESYLYKSTYAPLKITLEHTLVEKHASLIEGCFYDLIHQEKVEDVSLICKLLHCFPDSLKRLSQSFEQYAMEQGIGEIQKICNSQNISLNAEINKGQSVNPRIYVNTLFKIHKKLSNLVETTFNNNQRFVNALDRACREFMNVNPVCAEGSNRNVELLAKYADMLLRKDTQVDDAELETTLKYMITIFTYSEDKDIFQKLYQKMLAKRLVYQQSRSEKLEEKVIEILMDACGFEYTNKLQRMFNDVAISKDLCEKFKKEAEETLIDLPISDLFILVGGTHWPLTPILNDFHMPDEMEVVVNNYKDFYTKKFSGRKLEWLFNLGRVELISNILKFNGSPVAIGTTIFQAAILLLYNNNMSYTRPQIASGTEISSEQLDIHLHPLVKRGLLNCTFPDSGEAEYTLNTEFESNRPKIRLDVHTRKGQSSYQEQTHKSVIADRSLAVQAAMVRIMKRIRLISEKDLVSEVNNCLKDKFRLKGQDLQNCIAALIDEEYIERIKGRDDFYKYIV